MKIDEQSAIVTGGASGLGGATVDMLAQSGAKVAIFDMNEEQGKAKAKAVNGAFFKVDVTDALSVENAVAEARSQHGTARILVNCAGIGPAAKVIGRDGLAASLETFNSVLNVNLSGTFNVLSKFAAALHEAEPRGEERGVIVNTASVAAFDGQIGQAAYSASKGGVLAMALPIARDLMNDGVRVNTTLPGIFQTPMVAMMPPNVQEALAAQVPFPKRLGTAEEYARLAIFIVENPYLNAESIRLDGGIRMAPR